MFKHADPARRIPVYLQHGTVENLRWQLKLTAVVLGVIVVKDIVDNRRMKKQLNQND